MGANAGTAVPVYASGQVLDAARLNLTNCGVPVFSGTATRDAAFGGSGEKVLAEGQLCYVEDLTGVAQIQYYDGAAWVSLVASGVVQVVSTAKTNTFSTSSTTYTDITGFSVTITPTSASNKILILADLKLGAQSTVVMAQARLMRDSTAIYVGDAAGSRTQASSLGLGDAEFQHSATNIFLDSPATTSATTYKMQVRANTANSVHVNRAVTDSDSALTARLASSITVIEVTP